MAPGLGTHLQDGNRRGKDHRWPTWVQDNVVQEMTVPSKKSDLGSTASPKACEDYLDYIN